MRARAFFASLLTEDDKDSVPDLARIVWFGAAILSVIGILLFLVLGLVVAITGHTFDFIGYGTGFAAVLGGVAALMTGCGAALGFKTRSGA